MTRPAAVLVFLLIGATLTADYLAQAQRARAARRRLPMPHPGVLAWVLIGFLYLLVNQ